MGNCIYCSKPSGFLRKKHKECEQAYTSGKNQIVSLANAAALGSESLEGLSDKLKTIANTYFVNDNEYRKLVAYGWESAVEKSLDDGLLTKDEESKLVEFLKSFSLSQDDVNYNGAYTKIAQAAVLRDITEGKLPERITIQGNLPFNFQKNEKIVWLFKGVEYYEQKTRRQFVGGSHGVSIRIAKGLYYRVGAFKGQPVERTETVHVDNGLLAVTDKHIYFGGTAKSFRIPYAKIVSMTPYSDGIGIQRDAASAKPQSFVIGDGWFIYNLLSNLSKL